MTEALFGIAADTSVAFAEPKTSRQVRGADIAKTVARQATDEERWRYGVELRITGSRWRPQTRAPHYPTPEPYVYRKRVQSLAWVASDHNARIDQDYADWLAARDKAKLVKQQPAVPMHVDGTPADQWMPASNVVALVRAPMPAREAVPQVAPPDARRREIAGGYGPRRAHKLRAMADWLDGAVARAREAAP